MMNWIQVGYWALAVTNTSAIVWLTWKQLKQRDDMPKRGELGKGQKEVLVFISRAMDEGKQSLPISLRFMNVNLQFYVGGINVHPSVRLQLDDMTGLVDWGLLEGEVSRQCENDVFDGKPTVKGNKFIRQNKKWLFPERRRFNQFLKKRFFDE